MEFINHSPITKLNSSTIKWTIRARAQPVWKGITRETKEFRGLNILFVDDCRSRIHGFIAAKLAPLFENDLVEGEIYKISNFIMQEYTGMEFNRCVRFDKHIFFAHYTTMEKCSSTCLTIPKLVVELFSLEDLLSMEQDKRFLCDVCGVMKDPADFRDYMNDNDEPKQQKKFTLIDGSSEVSVTLFDELAKSFEEAMKKNGTEETIVILSSAKIGKFQGELNLTNYPATRFYLNAEHQAVKKLKKSLGTKCFSSKKEVIMTQLEKSVIEEMYVADIRKLKKETKVKCKVIVKKVQEDLNWFFYICTSCNVELNFVDGRYKCPECPRYYPWPQKRFRVFALCCDKSGVIPLMLGDREIRRITGKMVFDVELDMTEEKDGAFPPVFQALVKKEFIFTVFVKGSNVNEKFEVYEVSDVQMQVDDASQENLQPEQISQDAEDDNNTQVTNLFQQTAVSIDHQKNIGASTNLKTGEMQDESFSKKGTLNKLKNIKIKKEKIMIADKKKMKSTSQAIPTKGKKGRKLIDVISGSDDEDMTLNNYQMKNKKQGKQPVN